MHVNFHCGVSASLIFCYKITRVTLVSLANLPISLCNQYVRWDVREARVFHTGCRSDEVGERME